MGSENDASSLELHLKKLKKYCRVCAKVIKERETAHLYSENKDLLKTFNSDTTDQLHTHPKVYCHKCHIIAHKRVHNQERGKAFVETAMVFFKWESQREKWEEQGGECWVCERDLRREQRTGDDQGMRVARLSPMIFSEMLLQAGRLQSPSLCHAFWHRLPFSPCTTYSARFGSVWWIGK